ncbi:MAG: isocitrate/isopropylmalate family dehydrogenase, partial [Gemmatimonadota bacterium]
MSTTITLIPGDGIGPDITDATLRVLEAAGADLEYDRQVAGMAALHQVGNPLPEPTLDSARRTGVILKGPLTTPVGSGFRSINVALRKEFDLYANVRPAVTLMHGGRYEDIDLVLIRENTEGLYVGVEHYIGMEGDPKAAAESVMIITRFGAERIVRYAFEYAVRNARKKVTFAHKANILKYTQGLFLEVAREVAKDYPEIEWEDRIIDATAMQLVLDPYRFDVLVMENMFGDILSDLMAGLVGGLGFAPAGNIGEDAAMFEAVHGSAPDIAGQGIANPTGLLLSACLMLAHLDQTETA